MTVEQDVPPPAASAGERVDALLDDVVEMAASQRRLPESTYRVQFHAGFTFRDAANLVDYLHDLGITEFYASPYLKARPGSKHGYDICDHQSLNPEIGTQADYDHWVEAMQARGMGQILDIVPNHMGIVGNENDWWNDVLENGPCAEHASYFDIDWTPVKTELHNKVLLATLGEPYGKALESGQITLSYEVGTFVVHYFEHRFPVSPESALLCLRLRFDELEQALGKESADFMEYQSILTALNHLPLRSELDPLKINERYREKEVIKRRLQSLTDASAPIRDFILQNLSLFNGHPSNPHSFDLLDHLLNDQAYRLAFWQVASDEINYRRFFDVNELAALSMEKPEVFAATHGLVLRLLRERKVTGLRVDHPDGLYDPRQYFERLQQHYLMEQARRFIAEGSRSVADFELVQLENAIRNLLGTVKGSYRQPFYVVVEKILGKDEPIPDEWPIHGTVGYEFLNLVNGLFLDGTQEAVFTKIYQRWTDAGLNFRSQVYEKKFLILQVALSSELHMLAHQLDRLSEKNRWSRDYTLNSLRHALREIIACFPVYRSYITDEVGPRDRRYVEAAVHQAKRRNPAISSSIFDCVRDMILLRYPDTAGEADRAEQRRFVGKFQQVTGPVMAKGLEDTSFYVFNRLVSLNEVGGDPSRFGVRPAELHAFFEDRQAKWPYAMSASSTHDTKRSEDVRSRINVLTELPREWQKCLVRWKSLNKKHRIPLEALEAPDRNDEYFLYQTLIGAWPLSLQASLAALPVHALPAATGNGQAQERAAPRALPREFIERICLYMNKAVHEAKVHSSWINPDAAYDDAMREFILRILDEKKNARFLEDFCAFQKRISHLGLFNSLAQTLVKIAAPGVPDFYQGTELWDFSLVDPDNRRPVDYGRRQQLLQELRARLADAGERRPALARELVDTKEDGRIKLFVISQGLHCRRDQPGLFTHGDYVPAMAQGSRAENVFAFVRRREECWAMAVVPRLMARLLSESHDVPLGVQAWQESMLVLPGVRPHQRCRNVFTGEVYTPVQRDGQTLLPLSDVFAHFPVALLMPSN